MIGNVFILGDSYSTFEGYIPEGYAPYYVSMERPESDVTRVEQTWWYQLIEETNGALVQNNSYSGTTICHTGYEKSDCKEISFIGRLDKLIEGGYFKEHPVDTLIVFGGTNDSWADSPVGELQYENWKTQDLYSVLPAFAYLLHRLGTSLPETKVICVINTELKPVIEEGFKTACEKYQVDVVQLKDIDKTFGHPTAKGMTEIKEQIKRYLNTVSY